MSNSTPKFAQTRWGLEIRPIIGVRNADWELIANPIVDIGFGRYGEADFAPAARPARKLDSDLFVGLEYFVPRPLWDDVPRQSRKKRVSWENLFVVSGL
jgi:hypothetical protein